MPDSPVWLLPVYLLKVTESGTGEIPHKISHAVGNHVGFDCTLNIYILILIVINCNSIVVTRDS